MIQAPARKEEGPAKFASDRDGLGVIQTDAAINPGN